MDNFLARSWTAKLRTFLPPPQLNFVEKRGILPFFHTHFPPSWKWRTTLANFPFDFSFSSGSLGKFLHDAASKK